MQFDFTEEQYALRDAARDVLRGECTPTHIREMWDSETGRSDDLWTKLADTGIVGLTIDEASGGMGMTATDLVLILEEAGRVALPEPLIETTAIGAPLLAEAGTDDQKSAWLPRIASGAAKVTVQLNGALLVPDAHVADLLIVERDGELHALESGSFHATPQESLDGGRRVFTVEAEPTDATRMTGGADVAAAAFDRGAAATAAFLNGLSMAMLETTVAYAKERTQFNRPIGSFQAVKHKLAEVLLVVETSRAASWYAAYAIANDLPDRSEAASVAKSSASDAAAKASTESLQVHGGIGFTWEHDLHLWLKRAKALEAAYGTAREHRARLAEVILAS